MRNASPRLALLLAALLPAMSVAPVMAQPSLAEPATEVEAANGMKTIAVVGLSGYDRLLSDIDFLGNLMGQPNQGQSLEGMIAFFSGGKGLVGLDKSRPWGVVLQTDGSEFVPLACLPVTDLGAVLELLINFQIGSEDLGNGVFEIATPSQIVYAKQVGDWVMVGQTEESLAAAPADPLPMLTSLTDDYDLGASVLVDEVPEMFKQMAIGQLRAGLEAGLQQQDGESDEAFLKRRELGEAQVQQIVDAINDIDELTLGWAIDGDSETTHLDMVLTAVEGSKTAAQLEALRESETNLSAFIDPEAAATMSLAMAMSPEAAAAEAERVGAQMADSRQQFELMMQQNDNMPEEDREILLALFDGFAKSWEATVLKGKMDAAMSIDLGEETLAAFGAATLEEPENVVSALRDMDAKSKQKPGTQYPGIDWSVDSHGDVTFHSLKLPIPPGNPEVEAMFGAAVPIYLGMSSDMLYLAVTEAGLERTKAAIDASASAGPVSAKPMEVILSLSQIMSFAKSVGGNANAPMVTMVADMLANADGADHVILSVEPLTSGARYRLEMEKGVLKALGTAAAAARQAQMQGGF